MATDCVFCKIVRGDLDAPIVFQDAEHLVFLDKSPLFPGHCLVIPKSHYRTLNDVPSDQIGGLFLCAQRISKAVVAAMSAEGFFIGINNIVSQSVPHLHIHIVPRRKKDGLKGFFWPRSRYSGDDHIEETRAAIEAALRNTKATS